MTDINGHLEKQIKQQQDEFIAHLRMKEQEEVAELQTKRDNFNTHRCCFVIFMLTIVLSGLFYINKSTNK